MTEDQVRAAHRLYVADPEVTLRGLGRQLGLSGERVRQLFARLGLPTRPRGDKFCGERRRIENARPAVYQKIVRLLLAGEHTWAEVARRAGASAPCVARVAATIGVPVRRREPARHGSATMYDYHGCRCPECRRGANERQAAYYRDRQRRGLCRNCGKARVRSGTTSYCRACSDVRNGSAKARAGLVRAGLCSRCGAAPWVEKRCLITAWCRACRRHMTEVRAS